MESPIGRNSFPNARVQEARALRRVTETNAVPDDLAERIGRQTTRPENPLSTYTVTREYLINNFVSQARALFAASQSGDHTEQAKAFKQTFLRRHQFGENVHRALKTGALTELEQEHLMLIDGFGITLLDYAAKNLNLFYKRHGINERLPNDPSNIITVEAAQELAEQFIRSSKSVSTQTRSASGSATFLNETILPLCQSVLMEAMGKESGKKTYESLAQGSLGLAAAFQMYSDPALNRFGKSFIVRFPSPYLDAIEQTDLLLIDTENLAEDDWDAIAAALALEGKEQSAAINALRPETKAHVYKVQVKCRRNQHAGLSPEDIVERDSFMRQRCRAHGFDNGDYLVLNFDQAKQIIASTR